MTPWRHRLLRSLLPLATPSASSSSSSSSSSVSVCSSASYQRCFTSVTQVYNTRNKPSTTVCTRGDSRGKYLGGGKTKKFSLRLQNAGQNYKINHSNPKKPLYNCLLVLLLHTAAVTKDLGTRLTLGGQLPPPLPQRKTVPAVHSHLYSQALQEDFELRQNGQDPKDRNNS